MSTKVIKRNFELASNSNLRSAESGLDFDSNYAGNTMMDDARGKILTARNGTVSNDGGGCGDISIINEHNRPSSNSRRNANPFTFDTEDENYVNQRMMQIIDEDGFSDDGGDDIEDDTLVGHNVR